MPREQMLQIVLLVLNTTIPCGELRRARTLVTRRVPHARGRFAHSLAELVRGNHRSATEGHLVDAEGEVQKFVPDETFRVRPPAGPRADHGDWRRGHGPREVGVLQQSRLTQHILVKILKEKEEDEV